MEPAGRPADPRPERFHNAETDWAYWPNRGSAEFVAAPLHRASSIRDIRAKSYSVNPEITIRANQTFG